MSYYEVKDGSFAVGESQTSAIRINQGTLVGFLVSASTLTATTVTFLGSADGTNFYPLYNSESSEISLTTGSFARGYSLNSADFFPWNHIKARQGNSASAVLQANNAVSVQFVVRNV